MAAKVIAAKVKRKELTLQDPVDIPLTFNGWDSRRAGLVLRSYLRELWPSQVRVGQSIYVIRMRGNLAVEYGSGFSPVLYIGEGHAESRLANHVANWLADLLTSIPMVHIRVLVVDVARRNNPDLYKHVEADLIEHFWQQYGCIPWFNRQRETSHANRCDYTAMAWSRLCQLVDPDEKHLWGISPTEHNPHFASYGKGGL